MTEKGRKSDGKVTEKWREVTGNNKLSIKHNKFTWNFQQIQIYQRLFLLVIPFLMAVDRSINIPRLEALLFQHLEYHLKFYPNEISYLQLKIFWKYHLVKVQYCKASAPRKTINPPNFLLCAREQKMCKGTKKFPKSQNEVHKVPIVMGAKCYILWQWHVMVLNCRVCLLWMALCGLVWHHMALCCLVWPCVALCGHVWPFVVLHGLI